MHVDANPTDVAARARAVVSSLPGATVTDIGSTQHLISSSLTAVDLHGLTGLELAFAVLLVAGATGLILALGLAERRRTFAILAALGAKRDQLLLCSACVYAYLLSSHAELTAAGVRQRSGSPRLES